MAAGSAAAELAASAATAQGAADNAAQASINIYVFGNLKNIASSPKTQSL
jgi:hypothetical protein